MKKILLSLVTLSVLFLIGCSTSREASKKEQPAVVVVKFKSDDGYVMDTFWRKRNPDGSEGTMISTGRSGFSKFFNFPSKLYRVTKKRFPAGDYYLLKVEVNYGTSVMTSGGSLWSAKGWDENGKPYMLKFTVKEGDKTIEFPETVAYLRNGKKLVLEFKEPNTIFEIGDSVEIKK